MHGGGKREVEGAQAQDGEDVGGVDDEGVLGDGEDGRNRVDREDQVHELDDDERHEERRDEAGELAGPGVNLLHGELLAVKLFGDAEVPPDQLQHPVVLERGLFTGRPEHLEAGEDQEGAEQEQDPREGHDQRRTQADQHGTEQDDAEDAPEQHPVLVDAGDPQEGEDGGDDEDIVHRQRLLDQVAGEEFKA